ncbi:MAG TPA: YciI family protein [Pseudonocardiaceae bacterium]
MAEYLVLIYDDETASAAQSEAEFGEMMAAHGRFAEKNGAALRGGNALRPTETATAIRADGDGVAVTDGPFLETKEALGGYYLIEAPDLDAALAVAKQVPFGAGGGLEVRPVWAM